jgi:hypothetical protein
MDDSLSVSCSNTFPTMTPRHNHRITTLLVTLIAMLAMGSSTLAFAPQFRPATTKPLSFDGTVRDEPLSHKTTPVAPSFLEQAVSKSFATMVLAASVWCAPAMLASVMVPTTPSLSLMEPKPTTTVQQQWQQQQLSFGSGGGTAFAKEMASGSGSRVNKDPESLLRYGLPISNPEVRVCMVGNECRTKPSSCRAQMDYRLA